MADVIENKLGKIPTFGELYDLFGKELYIVTFNYTEKEEVILSHETSSSMSILTGLRMSSNVPFVFENFNYQGDFYFDGVDYSLDQTLSSEFSSLYDTIINIFDLDRYEEKLYYLLRPGIIFLFYT